MEPIPSLFPPAIDQRNPNKAQWAWSLDTKQGQQAGYLLAVDARDAVSRMLVSTDSSGRFLGEVHAVPPGLIQEVPANASTQFTGTFEGGTLVVQKVVCPDTLGQLEDIQGCGSSSVVGPDEEGFFDCNACGLFFKFPLTEEVRT